MNNDNLYKIMRHMKSKADQASENLTGTLTGSAGLVYVLLKNDMSTEWKVGLGALCALMTVYGGYSLSDKIKELSDIAKNYRDEEYLNIKYKIENW